MKDGDDTIIRMWLVGNTVVEIATSIHRTKNVVSGRTRRLIAAGVIKGRGAPIPQSGARNIVSRARSTERTTPLSFIPPLPPLESTLLYSALFQAGPAHAAALPIPPAASCQFPMWHDDEPPTHCYCGHLIRARSYCLEHTRRCYGAISGAAA